MRLDRRYIIQWLIDKKRYNTYLEVGLADRKSFFSIKAKRKILVDPTFRPGRWKRMELILNSWCNFNASYYKMESHVFFERAVKKALGTFKIDICLVNSNLEYQSALMAVESSLPYLSEGGVIIIPDCYSLDNEMSGFGMRWRSYEPDNKVAADIWKVILQLRSTRSDINVFVLNLDNGLGVVTKGTQEEALFLSPGQVSQLTNSELHAHKEEWLNLKPGDYFYNFFKL